ncbi:MAG TPA: cupin domain-containing protein [Acidimicrobiales bacterium]|nr:cupin domain-containing protein [Acidimicrobiales bacterium]
MAADDRTVRRVAAGTLSADTAQSSGMRRLAAVSGRLTASEALFMGETHMAAGAVSGNHHHGVAETAIYVVSGSPVFVYLEHGVEVRVEAAPGDYVYVPPFAPHREENPGDEVAVVVIARTTDESIVVNLERLDEPSAPGRS